MSATKRLFAAGRELFPPSPIAFFVGTDIANHQCASKIVRQSAIIVIAMLPGSTAFAVGSSPSRASVPPVLESSLLKSPLQWAATVEYLAATRTEISSRQAALTLSDYDRFGAVGVIVCTFDGQRRASTAFLVGKFDLAVTVAHVFEHNGSWAQPSDCFYTSVGARGQIRERVPVASIKAQWQLDARTFGHTTSDLAVAKLAQPAQWARRTLPFTRYSGKGAPVLLIGLRADPHAGAMKRKTRGVTYVRAEHGCPRFTHDLDTRRIAAGAPLIDARDGAVIGIHARINAISDPSRKCIPKGNAMIPMNQWLEQTLRAEIEGSSPAIGDTPTVSTDTAPSP